MSNAWRNLMRTLAGHPLAFSQAIQWLTRLSLEKATLAASLWTSLFTKGTGQYLGGVEAAMMADSRALDLATKCLLAATDRRAGFLGVLGESDYLSICNHETDCMLHSDSESGWPSTRSTRSWRKGEPGSPDSHGTPARARKVSIPHNLYSMAE